MPGREQILVRQRLWKEQGRERNLFVLSPCRCVLSFHLSCRRNRRYGHQSRPVRWRRRTWGRGPPDSTWVPFTLAGGALQHLENNSSSLVTNSSQMSRYCHIKSIFMNICGPNHFQFSLIDCAEVDF